MQDREAEPRFAGPPSREFNATKGSTFSGNFSGGGGGGGGGSGGRQIYVSNVCNPLASPPPPLSFVFSLPSQKIVQAWQGNLN